jgi:nucleoside-diphosphate-sugar epimerase
VVKAIAAAAGKEANIVHYDPSAVKLPKGQGFPFRTVHFFASSDKAKRVLGWKPQHTFLADVPQRLEEYNASGRAGKEMDFSADDLCLAAAI